MGRRVFEPNEDEIAAAILDHWRAFGAPGSLVASIPNRRAFGQAGLTPGLPDLIVISPKLGSEAGFIELKTRKGRRSAAQIAIGELLLARGCPYAVTHGRDEPIRVLVEWGAVRMRVSHGIERSLPARARGVQAGA
jgi:hypothetical protein